MQATIDGRGPQTGKTWSYKRPQMYRKQELAIFDKRRYSLIEASTKSGKTVACMVWISEMAMRPDEEKNPPGANYWWVAPTYKVAKIPFNRLCRALPPGIFKANKSELSIHILPTDTFIWFKGSDEPDNLYGEDVYGAVIDEASRCKEEAWFAIRSTLTATRGPIRIIGNVKGKKNWFYKMARRAEKAQSESRENKIRRRYGYHKITAWDAVAGGVLEQDEIEDAQESLPENVFKELYGAEASDDEGNPFGSAAIEACGVLPELRPLVEYAWARLDKKTGDPVPVAAWGWDLARKRDYTVGIGLDRYGDVVRFLRFQKPWNETIYIIRDYTGTYTPAFVDQTGVGDTVVGVIQRPVEGGTVEIDHSARRKAIRDGAAGRTREDASKRNGHNDQLGDWAAGVGGLGGDDDSDGEDSVGGGFGDNGAASAWELDDGDYDEYEGMDEDEITERPPSMRAVSREFASDENIEGYLFTQRSKQSLMEGLAVALQQHVTRFPRKLKGRDHPIYLELDSFEYEYTRTGVRYSAPEGENDDCVCAYALAIQCLQQRAVTLPAGIDLAGALSGLTRTSPWNIGGRP